MNMNFTFPGNWRQGAAIIGSFLGVIGGVFIAAKGWDAFSTPGGVGGLLISIGGWATSLMTYSVKDNPIGNPENK